MNEQPLQKQEVQFQLRLDADMEKLPDDAPIVMTNTGAGDKIVTDDSHILNESSLPVMLGTDKTKSGSLQDYNA